MTPDERERLYIESRLPNKQFVSVPEIAVAFNRCRNTITSYIESGQLGRVRNFGSKSKRCFEVSREEVVKLWISQLFTG